MISDNSANNSGSFPRELSSVYKAMVYFPMVFIISKIGFQIDFSKIRVLTFSSGSFSITADLSSAKDSLNLALQNANNLAKQSKSFDKTMLQYQVKNLKGNDYSVMVK